MARRPGPDPCRSVRPSAGRCGPAAASTAQCSHFSCLQENKTKTQRGTHFLLVPGLLLLSLPLTVAFTALLRNERPQVGLSDCDEMKRNNLGVALMS